MNNMPEKIAKLAPLRERIAPFQSVLGSGRVTLGHAGADRALSGGLLTGVLHEVFPAAPRDAAAASAFALTLAARLLGQHKYLLWVRQDFSALEHGDIHGAGLIELGADPRRVLMVRAADAMGALRAGAEGLHCKGLACVIIEHWAKPKMFDLLASRRLALGAQPHGVTPIFLHFGMAPQPSAAETRWLIGSAASPPDKENWGRPCFDAGLPRNRRGQTGHWIMEWDSNNAIFKADSRRVASASADGQAEAPLESFRQAG